MSKMYPTNVKCPRDLRLYEVCNHRPPNVPIRVTVFPLQCVEENKLVALCLRCDTQVYSRLTDCDQN